MPIKQKPCFLPNSLFGDNPTSGRWNRILPGFSSGVKVDGWRKKIKAGSNATGPYSTDRYEVMHASPLGGSATVLYTNNPPTFTYGTYPFSWSGYLSDLSEGDFAHIGSVSSDAEAQALKRMYDKIRSESYGANGLLFLGELRETIHLIRHPLSTLQDETKKYLSALKSARRDVQKRVVRRKSDTDRFFVKRRLDAVKNAVSGTWLEFQFGALPLIHDIADIASTAIDHIYGRDDKIRLRAKSTDTVTQYASSSVGYIWYSLESYSTVNRSTVAGVQYVVGMKKSLTAPTSRLERLSKEFGFQIQNFAPTAYELFPYSFLLDYFTNTGNILEAACTDTSSVAWICRTERRKTSVIHTDKIRSFNPKPKVDPDFWTAQMGGRLDCSRRVLHITTTRTNPDTLGIPPLVLSMPGIDSMKWLNIGALLGQSRGFRFK